METESTTTTVPVVEQTSAPKKARKATKPLPKVAAAERSIAFAQKQAQRLNGVITVLVPHAKGPSERSASAARFNKYRTGMTVASALKAGLWSADLRYDEAHGFIKVKK